MPTSSSSFQSNLLQEINLGKRVIRKKINLEYVFWTPEVKDKQPSTRSAFKRKAPPNPKEIKYIEVPSNNGKIYFAWDIENVSFLEFKRYTCQAIRRQDTVELGNNTELLDKQGATILDFWRKRLEQGGKVDGAKDSDRLNKKTNRLNLRG